jgi:hypothetical protein
VAPGEDADEDEIKERILTEEHLLESATQSPDGLGGVVGLLIVERREGWRCHGAAGRGRVIT